MLHSRAIPVILALAALSAFAAPAAAQRDTVPRTGAERPKATEPRPNASEPRPRAAEPARSTATEPRGQATGRNPDPDSAGGEGQQARGECPSTAYCENVVRQVRRYFRPPEGVNGSAEVCFTIQRDGGVEDVEVSRVRGGLPFRLAVQEAVEQAGRRKAFGALPGAFNAATLPVCVVISPQP